jgi:hypothetical protein
MKTRIMLAAAAAALALLPVGEAAAQGNSYCNGRVQAASFYSTTSSTGTRSTVSYYVIIQSMVGESQAVRVTFNNPRAVSRADGRVAWRMAPWGTSQAIFLGVSILTNPSGTGGLSVPSDLAAGTQVTCQPVHRSG